MADDYESLLLNFELLSSLDSDIALQKYVLAEHLRRRLHDVYVAALERNR